MMKYYTVHIYLTTDRVQKLGQIEERYLTKWKLSLKKLKPAKPVVPRDEGDLPIIYTNHDFSPSQA